MTIEKKLIKAVEDYFSVKYDRFIGDGNSHEEAVNLAKMAVYATADSVALKKVIHTIMEARAEKAGFVAYARYGNENQPDGKEENE